MSTPKAIGRYQVRERLGQGGMGVLYLALDPAIDRLLALKLLRVNHADIRERFLREGRLAARLQHPNIVTIFDVGEYEGQPFIAMEYIPGETLAELIARRAPLPLNRRLELIVDACKGLAFAHKHGVVHRDVKPANLMISRESGALKVLDFGIARGIDSNLTQAGMLMGTPNYMSPEQLEGRAVDHRSDIFALGLVLYEVLAYRQAFSGETPQAVWHQVASSDPPPILERSPTLDSALPGIIDRAIAKRADDRYPDLDRLRLDLQRVIHRLDSEQAGATVVDEPATPASPGKRSDFARLAERRSAQIAAHLGRAEAALAAQDLDRAQEAVEEAAMIDPGDQRVLAILEQVRHELDAREVAAWLQDAEAAIRTGALTTAAGLVSRALQMLPSHGPALALRTTLQRAIEARERALERDRAVALALEQAEEHLAAGSLDAALRATSEALGFDPQAAAAIDLRNRIQQAAASIEEAIGLARAEAASERFATALRRLDQLRPRDARVDAVEAEIREAWQSADLRRQAEETERRRRDEAVRRRDQVDAQVREARAHLSAGELAAASSCIESALAADPAHLEAAELRREIDSARSAQEARRERDARVRRALEHARGLADAGRHLDALAELEPFQDVPTVASLIRTLRAALAEIDARAKAEAGRQARDAHDRRVAEAIARAHDLLAQQRGDEALAVLEAFGSADERILDALAVLRREVEGRIGAQRAMAAARAGEAVDRARRDAGEGRLGAAIASLERFLPRHHLVDEALDALRTTHERQAHDTCAKALTLASLGREADAFALLQQFDPPHPAVADALIRLRAESVAREVRRQADAAARQRAAEAQAERRAVEAWVVEQCDRARSALNDARFEEAQQTAQGVLARVPDAVDAARILDEAIARQADSEAAAERRAEVERTLVHAGAALGAGDPTMARAHLDAAAALGAAREQLEPLRERIATFEAEREADRRRELHERRAASAVDAARALFRSGEEVAAIKRLERFEPRHEAVTAALEELRATRALLDRQRQEAAAAERARLSTCSEPALEDDAPITDDTDALVNAGPAPGADEARAEGTANDAGASRAGRRRVSAVWATAALVVIVVAATAVRLIQREAPAAAGKLQTGTSMVAGKQTPDSPGDAPDETRSVRSPGDDVPSGSRPTDTGSPKIDPDASPVMPLIVDAAPWGQVTGIVHADTSATVPLDAERNTPYLARLPAGTYDITVQRFDRSQKRRVTLRAALDNRVLFEFEAVDVDEYLRRLGS